MKTFIYTKTKEETRKIYGGCNYIYKVYRIVKNEPIFVCEVSFCNASCRGTIHEILHGIVEAGQLPRKAETTNGFINHDYSENYKLMEL